MYFGYGLDILQTTAKVSQVTNVRLNRAPLVFIKPRKKKKAKVRANSWHCIKNKYTILSAVKNIITQFFRDFFEVEQKDDNLRAFL